MPEISVLILTWNRKDDLVEAINSVLIQEGVSFEIVIVDSASDDGTGEIISERLPEAKCVRLPYNLGVIGGRNVGIANCSADLVFFLDDDAVLVGKDVLKKVVRKFAEMPDMWALTCKVLDNSGELWKWLVNGDPARYAEEEMLSQTFVGCAACVRRAAFDELGYFDPVYFREGEEFDFSLRVYSHDRFVLYYPGATVIHRVNQEQRNPSGIVGLNGYRNNILTYFKHLPIFDALIFSTWNFFIDGIRSLRQGYFPYYLLGNLHLVYLVPNSFLKKRQKMSKAALCRIYLLRSQPVLASEWERVKTQNGASLWDAILAYTKRWKQGW